MMIWFLLVDEEGVAYKETSASSVRISSSYFIDQFRDAVKAKYADSHLKGIAPSNLRVYANKADFDAKDTTPPLDPRTKLSHLHLKREDVLYVVVREPRADQLLENAERQEDARAAKLLEHGHSIDELCASYDLLQFIIPRVLMDVPTTHSSRAIHFKRDLCAYYQCSRPEGIRCMLLNITFPASVVTASHLFRRSNEYLSLAIMQIADIDDVRNGLLLFKPVEHAFDKFQISFLYDKATDRFFLKVFDTSIRNETLISFIQDPNQLKALLDTRSCTFDPCTTFGDLDGKPLVFETLDRPYKRCLNLQARLAYAKALKRNDAGAVNFEDFWSDGLTVGEKMRMFHQSILSCNQVT
jgi:hypothetical protein